MNTLKYKFKPIKKKIWASKILARLRLDKKIAQTNTDKPNAQTTTQISLEKKKSEYLAPYPPSINILGCTCSSKSLTSLTLVYTADLSKKLSDCSGDVVEKWSTSNFLLCEPHCLQTFYLFIFIYIYILYTAALCFKSQYYRVVWLVKKYHFIWSISY